MGGCRTGKSGTPAPHEKSRLVVTHRAALENEMKTSNQFISSRAAAQAAALLSQPALPKQHREARRVLRAWQQQQSQPRQAAR